MAQLLLFNITNGLIIGAFYVLMALGLSLILNLSNTINFAHGGFLVIGGYIAYAITPYIGFWGALLIAPPLTAIIGIAVERVLIRPLYGRDPLYSLLLTFGLAFIIEDGTRFIFGPQGKPVTIPPFLAQPLSNDFFFITGYRVFMVAVVVIAVTLLFLLLRFTRLGIRIRAGTLDLETVAALGINVQMLRSLNFAVGIFLAGLSGVLAAGQLGLEPTMGTGLLMPSFIAIIVGGIGSLPGTLLGGLSDRGGIGIDRGLSAGCQRSGYLRSDGGGPSDPAARIAGRRRNDDLSAEQSRKLIVLAVIWLTLIFAPYWMVPLGGYTALATRVLVLGLAAMSLNFLLGFTGVLSFGHAAYFGLGAYGAGLTLKFLALSTPLALVLWNAAWRSVRRHPGDVDRAPPRRLFRHGDDRLRPGVLLHRVPVEFADRRRRRPARLLRQPIDFGVFKLDIISSANTFYFFVLVCFALAVGAMGFILRSPFGRTMIAIRENERRARFLGIPVERHIWIAFTLSCFFMGFAGALYALVNNFADPRGLHYSQSGDFVMMAVMGGMRSFWGPLLGAAVFVVLQDYLSSVTVNWMSFVGLLFVLVVLFFPRGLLGFLQRSKA